MEPLNCFLKCIPGDSKFRSRVKRDGPDVGGEGSERRAQDVPDCGGGLGISRLPYWAKDQTMRECTRGKLETLRARPATRSQSGRPTLPVHPYHWPLLYDWLRVCCEFHNYYSREASTQTPPVGPYQIGPFDFDLIVDLYFWDTDFLLERPILTGLGLEGRKSTVVFDEAFGISLGLPPHPDELKVTPWAKPSWKELGEEAVGLLISEYPPAE